MQRNVKNLKTYSSNPPQNTTQPLLTLFPNSCLLSTGVDVYAERSHRCFHPLSDPEFSSRVGQSVPGMVHADSPTPAALCDLERAAGSFFSYCVWHILFTVRRVGTVLQGTTPDGQPAIPASGKSSMSKLFISNNISFARTLRVLLLVVAGGGCHCCRKPPMEIS